MKTLIMLIGPKGSGKTTIGHLAEAHTPITFLPVEDIWLNLEPGQDGWAEVERHIDALFATTPFVMIESLGAGDDFARFHSRLAAKYHIMMVRVTADLETCFQRVKARDASAHLPISDADLRAYNAIADQVRYDWALEIDNNGPASAEAVVTAIRGLLTSGKDHHGP